MASWPRSTPWIRLLLLWGGGVFLFTIGLGGVLLRDWDESLVARVALELSHRSWPDLLLPTYLGQPYLNKPPGLHGMIAAAIRLWELAAPGGNGAVPPEGLVRLMPALCSSALIPLTGLVQVRLRPGQPTAALATAVISLTLLPVVRHGRLAMLDGTQLSAMTLLWLGLLIAEPRHRRFVGGLLAGLAGSALLLLKSPVAVPVLAGALLLRALDRDLQPRDWFPLLSGLVVGLLPGLGWHAWHGWERGPAALVMWGMQGMARVVSTVDHHSGGPIVPLVQVLIGGWPWLPLWPFAIALAWRRRRERWGRWVVGLTLLNSLLVFPLRTQLPWYSLLVWPPFALACGPVLAELSGPPDELPRRRTVIGIAGIWLLLGLALLLVVIVSLSPMGATLEPYRELVLPAALGLSTAGVLLLRRQDSRPATRRSGARAVIALVSGWFLSLLLLFSGPNWNWELNEKPPITPAVALARVERAEAGPGRLLPLSVDQRDTRPSLLWYAAADFPPFDGSYASVPPGSFLLLARRDPSDGREGIHCRPERSGEDGWQLWLCHRQSGRAEHSVE